MTRLAREGLLGSLAKVNLPTCEPYMAGKACQKPFGKAKRATHPSEFVHSDICGPTNVRARHGAFYFLTFIDEYSHYGSVYLLSYRSEELDCFKRFLAEKAQFRRLMPMGSVGFVHSTSHKCGKLGPRASKLILIRYCEHSKGYVMYGEHPDKGMAEIESRDVDFPKDEFPSISEVKGNLEHNELRDPQGAASGTVKGETPHSYLVIDGDNESDPRLSGSYSLEENNSQNPQLQRSKRGGIPRRRYEIEGESFMCPFVDIDEPATYEETVTSPNANE
ncbi:UNVERIFIED_CONTAM: hypothetical protein Slati_2243600 [Sesamum latifolium]|uniref:Retroviral polymerase SH3-like domain-containing protein n=1 Tax=Sesamum latifolium TaxID=2727402 RepID=A0AAW2WU24_9LAMI